MIDSIGLVEAVEQAMDGVVITDAGGRIQYVNPAFTAMTGYSSEEVLGHYPRVLKSGHHSDDFYSELWSSIKSGRNWHSDMVNRRKDGTLYFEEMRITPVRNQDGEVLRYIAIKHDVTRQRAAEEALRESEHRFRILADCCPAVMWVTDALGNSQFINRAHREFCGASDEQLAGDGWQSLFHPDDVCAYVDAFQHAVREQLPFAREARLRRIDGQWRWVDTHAKPRFSKSGEFLGHAGVCIDITDRKQAADALRESEERFRIMADGCPASMWVTNAEGGIEFINKAYREFMGTTYEEVEGQKWQMVLHPDDAPAYLEACQRAVREHASFQAETRVRRADCEWRWADSHAEPRFSKSGEFLGHVGISPDITELKQALLALLSSEEKFRQLAENVREVFWMMTRDAERLLYVSPAYEQIWGRTCESAYQNPMLWLEAIHPEDLEQARKLLAVRDTEQPAEAEFRIRTPDGQEKWIRDRAFPVCDEAGQVVRVVGVAEDITEQRHYREELIRAREGAESANRAKSRFLANMSHELRTPMNGVLGMVQLLETTDLTEEQQHYVTIAQNSGRALLAIIDEILDHSKIEARKVVLECRQFNPHSTIEDVLQMIRVQASAKGLQVRSRVPVEIPQLLRGDAQRLRQVLTNLCGNAVKFTEHGEIALDAQIGHQDEGRVCLRFTITDTGIGISQDQIARLFSPFVQADDSTTRKFGGTGLGLALSKQLVELMGGAIGVESRGGEGSTFWFTAVFECAPGGQGRPSSEPNIRTPKMLCRTNQNARNPRILVAEDNATNRQVILAQLQKLGYPAKAVINGVEAVEAVRQGGFQLVLMDCQMPVMDGFEATRAIRESSEAGIPIVAVTADAMPSDRDRCLAAGMDDYLAKPVDVGRLSDLLAKLLRKALSASQEPKLAASKPEQSTCGVFNQEDLLDRLMGDRQLAGRVVKGFLDDAPAQLNNLRGRLDETDAHGAGAHAHALKGAAATVAAKDLAAIALAMERAGMAGDLGQCVELLPRAVEEFNQFKNTVELAGWV